MQITKDHALKMIALALGTRPGHKELEDHYLDYLVMKFDGRDGLSLDSGNYKIFQRLKVLCEPKR